MFPEATGQGQLLQDQGHSFLLQGLILRWQRTYLFCSSRSLSSSLKTTLLIVFKLAPRLIAIAVSDLTNYFQTSCLCKQIWCKKMEI